MKKSVKWLSLLCALMLLVGLTACGKDPESSAPGSMLDVSDTAGNDSTTTTTTDSGLTDSTDEASGTTSSNDNSEFYHPASLKNNRHIFI